MMGGEAPEACWATHKRQVINLWSCCFLLVDLLESYDDARTCKRQKYTQYIVINQTIFSMVAINCLESFYIQMYEHISNLIREHQHRRI
jgi:hypothetical protein